MKLNLFQIEQQYIVLAESIIENDGVLTDELNEALQINKEQLQTKGACYGYIIKDLEGDIDKIDAEIKHLQALKSSRNKTINRLKETLTNAMNLYEITELKTPTIKISFRKSESVEVESPDLLSDRFKSIKVVQTPDKVKIKLAIEAGESVVGAVLKQNQNLQIR